MQGFARDNSGARQGYYEITTRTRYDKSKASPRILQGNYKGTRKYENDKNTKGQTRASKDSMGTDRRTRISSLPKEGGRRHRSESCTVDLGRKEENAGGK